MSRRVLPHNLDAEASILGGILLRNDVLSQLDTLEVEDFYDHKHKVVFQAETALQTLATTVNSVRRAALKPVFFEATQEVLEVARGITRLREAAVAAY